MNYFIHFKHVIGFTRAFRTWCDIKEDRDPSQDETVEEFVRTIMADEFMDFAIKELDWKDSKIDDLEDDLKVSEETLDDERWEHERNIEDLEKELSGSFRVKAGSLHDNYKLEELQRLYNKYTLEELKKL